MSRRRGISEAGYLMKFDLRRRLLSRPVPDIAGSTLHLFRSCFSFLFFFFFARGVVVVVRRDRWTSIGRLHASRSEDRGLGRSILLSLSSL